MKREVKRTKQISIKPSVVKLAEKLQKQKGAYSFSELVEVLILEATNGQQ